MVERICDFIMARIRKEMPDVDDEKAEVVVKADEKVKSSVILDIMDAAQDAKYKKLIVAGEPLNKKEQKELEEMSENSSTLDFISSFILSSPTDETLFHSALYLAKSIWAFSFLPLLPIVEGSASTF